MRPAESDADVAVAAPRAERIDYASIQSPQTKWIVLAGMLMGLFLAALDQTIVATALPAIIADLRGIDLLAWVSTGYLVASATAVPGAVWRRLRPGQRRGPVPRRGAHRPAELAVGFLRKRPRRYRGGGIHRGEDAAAAQRPACHRGLGGDGLADRLGRPAAAG